MKKKVHTISDLKELARQRLPSMLFDYIEGGSWTESALRRNRSDLDNVLLRQRVVSGISSVSTESKIAGINTSAPMVLAPCGLTGLMRGGGEIQAALAAHDFGIPYCLSMYSIASIEELKKAHATFWFQLYPLKDRGLMKSLMNRAEDANCSSLVLTLDGPVLGKRLRDHRNQMSSQLKMNMRNSYEFLKHPRWMWDIARSGPHVFGNLEPQQNVKSLSVWNKNNIEASFTWDDISWIRREWKGILILKGINDVEDAIQAEDFCDVIVVSNHGGRQMDCAPSTIQMLPLIRDRLKQSNVSVHVDGGVESGTDIAKYLASGAEAVWVGRSFLYGLIAGGYTGVIAALRILHEELSAVTVLAGQSRSDELGLHNLV